MFKLSLDNYRGFIKEEFDFSRINILIGENSAGKSSLIKFLLALKQSITKPNDNELNLTLIGDQVDLGNYREIIFHHDDTKNLSFCFEFKEDYYHFFIKEFKYVGSLSSQYTGDKFKESNDQLDRFDKIISKYKDANTSVSFELTKNLNQHINIKSKFYNSKIGTIEILHSELSEKSEDGDTYLFDPPKCTLKFSDLETEKTILLHNVEFEKRAFMTIITGKSIKAQIKGLEVSDEQKNVIFIKIAFLLITQNYLHYNLTLIRFVNPINSKPERFYFVKDSKRSNIVNDIEGLVNFVSGLNKKNSQTIIADFTAILSDYGITESVDIRNTDNSLRELRVKVKDLWSNITDVGYGVSLQLPILFQAMISDTTSSGRAKNIFRKGQILLIEQPEVHLHPRLQAKFIETLIKIGSNNTYFIETHSEYIIRKLQVLVKEKSYGIDKSDVSINYLRRDSNKFIKTKHQIEENGLLKPNFPAGFFDNSYILAERLID
jgi:predicted ATPase